MLLGFGYLYVCYVLFIFSSKRKKFCNILLFFLKVGSVGPVDQQVNFVFALSISIKIYL